MKKVLLVFFAVLALTGKVDAQWRPMPGNRQFAIQRAWAGRAYYSPMAFQRFQQLQRLQQLQHLQQLQWQRYVQVQAMAAYPPMYSPIEYRPYVPEPAAWTQYPEVQQQRLEERIGELDAQQERIVSQLNQIRTRLLSEQAPMRPSSRSTSNDKVAELRSELQALREALGVLREELSKISPNH